MNELTKIEMLEKSIRNALYDYGLHTRKVDVLSNVRDEFICRLARDNYYAKSELRELFRKSPAWDEELDAIVINGTRTHNPDYRRIRTLALDILELPILHADAVVRNRISDAIDYFSKPDCSEEVKEYRLQALKRLAPHAYHPGRKNSRVFKILCEELGVSERTSPGFSRQYAVIADEMSSRKIDFKLFVSINAAHFITMSNPKDDERGDSLTSCHSFNSTDYRYNNGCSGYARDNYTFIVFTVADPSNPELLNNRKAIRQIFCYKPGNGVLLQSRLYNDHGGVNRELEESGVYRDLIQREISALEDQPNLWTRFMYYDNKRGLYLEPDRDFGGYPDWTYEDFCAVVSIRRDHESDYKPFTIGAAGLCIKCGKETSDGLVCRTCRYTRRCDFCGNLEDEDDLIPVYNHNGEREYVCRECIHTHYIRCDDCGEYYPKDHITWVADGDHSVPVCPSCLGDCYLCDHCGTYQYRYESLTDVVDTEGRVRLMCDSCAHESGHTRCIDCRGCGGVPIGECCPKHHGEGEEI